MRRYIVRKCPFFQKGKPNCCMATERGICHTINDCDTKKIEQILRLEPKYNKLYINFVKNFGVEVLEKKGVKDNADK